MDVGKTIKEYRKKKNLTQQELALMVGLTQSAIGKYESGQRTPPLDVIERITKVLGVKLISPESDLNFDVVTHLCSILGYNAEYITEEQYINENTAVKYPYLHIFGEEGTEEYKIPMSVIHKTMDRYFEHMRIDFKAFLEDLNNGTKE